MADINDLKELLSGRNSSSNKVEIKTFTGGMNKNGSELYLQGTEYRHAKNFVNKGDGRDLFSMVNEKGTLEIDAVLPTGFSVIGYFVLGSDIIVALADDSGNSQIGIIDADNFYTRKVPTDTDVNAELGFSKSRPIDIEARKLFTGERVVYFTDYPKNFGSVSLDSPPVTGDISDNIKAVPNISIPSVRLDVIREDSGSLNVGIYQFIARYKTESLNATSYGIPSNIIPIVDNRVSEGRDKYDGEYYDFGNVNKSIRLNIENIDTSFPYLEIVVIRRTGSLNTFVAEALPLINITTSEITFTYNGTETDRTPVSLEELRAEGITYESAKNVAQKDGVLFYSNLVDGGRKFDQELQLIANNIEVYYEIEEVPYGDARFGLTSIPFGLYSEPYIKNASETNGDEKTIVLKFNKSVDQSTLTVLTNYSLDVLGTNVVFENPTSATLVGLDSVELLFASTPTSVSKIEIINIEDTSNNETYDSGGYISVYGSIITTESNILTEDSFLDYKNEQMTHYKKTYRRGEVYSFSFDVNFNNGNKTLCFHIPGNDKSTNLTTDADTITGKLGTYVSTKEYPPNQNYPGVGPEYDESFGLITSFVRHHKMPTLEQEPHYRNDGSGVLIRLIKLKFKFNEEIPEHIAKEIQSITIRRERRNVIENKSILAQGIVHQYVKTSSDINADGNHLNTIYKKMPFFNNTSITIANESVTGDPSVAFKYETGVNDKMAFHSPDTDLIEFNPNEANGAKIKPVAKIFGNKEYVKKEYSKTLAEFFVAWGEANYHKYMAFWMYCIYNDIDIVSLDGEDIIKSNFIQQNSISQPDGLDFKLDNQDTSRHLFLKTSVALPSGSGVSSNVEIVFGGDLSIGTGGLNNNPDQMNYSSYNENYLYNIELNNTAQYGDIGNSEYVHCITSRTLPINSGDEIVDVFGGDTFIGAYSVRNCDIYYHRGLSRSAQGLLGVTVEKGYYDNTTSQVGAYQKGADFRSFSYFIVESNVNTEYRHKYIDRTDEDNPIAEPTYFPLDSAIDVLSVQVQEGDSRGYNTLYSYEDNIITNFTRGNTESSAGNYETRIIYSDKAFETERRDSFKVFPVNNFHDLPKHTGPITNTFVHANTLFSHTPKALWRHYVGDVVREATSIGDIVMGPGGMFTNPSKMVVDSTGGYGGCVNKYGCIETPFGFFFPDLLQNKMFILLGEKLEDIGVSTMSSFFEKNMNIDMFTGSVVNDNPFSGIGYSAGYDPLLNRVIISKVSGESSFTYSYSFYSGKFISEHDYIGSCYINRDLNMYSFIPDNTSMWHHNKGDYGSFYGNLYPSSITVEFVEEPFYEKVFDNVVVKSKSFNNDKRIELDTFNSCDFYTKNRRSGEIGLVVGNKFPMTLPNDQRKITFTKDKYHMSIPLDAVMDYGNDIFNNSNIDFNKMFKTRLKGSSLFTTFTYDNNDNYKFVLDLIGISYRINHG